MTLQTREQIRQFLTSHFSASDLADHTDIFAAGYVNSLFGLQLVLFIERTFDLSVVNEDLDLSNFRSVDALTAFVGRKQRVIA